MYVHVNGAKLYFDIEGSGLIANGTAMRAKPTLILLHGGPGLDHTMFKPAFSRLADAAQIVYYDHRGNGRSERGSRDSWNLAQWGDDVKGLCDALGLVRPIVLGLSFGGFVAQSYAMRHPDHPAGLILSSTAAHMDFAAIFAAFESIGGAEARAIAEAYWLAPTPERRARYRERCFPLYRPRPDPNRDAMARAIVNDDLAVYFAGPGNEMGRLDFRAALKSVRCPVLVLAGDRDPITPIQFSETIAACLPPALARFERFAGCGHGVHVDEPERAFGLIREFIAANATE